MAESGWADYVKAQLTLLGNKLDEMANNGQLQELASNISTTFITIAETIKAFFADLTLEDFVKRTTDGFKSIADSAGAVITVVTSVGNGISAMLNSFSLVVKGAGAVIATVIGGIADGVADLVGFLGFEDLEDKVQLFADGMIPVSKAFGESMAKDAHKVRESYKAIGKAITTETPKIADTLKQVKAQAENSGEDEMELLNQQDMDKLNRALEQAERQMHSLQNSTRSTLEGLQDELDRLDGNTEAIERRRFEARNPDLEEKLKQAQSKGDGHAAVNLQQALSLNQRVFNKTRDKRENEERETRRRKSFDRAPPPRNGAGQRNESPSKVIRLEYPGSNVKVSVRQGDDVKLLRALKESGARVI